MKRTERVEAMEAILREVRAAAEKLEGALAEYAALRPRAAKLYAYYGSRTWFADRAADEAGKLPKELPRGVLGEDEVYDLISMDQALLADMLALAADMVSGN